MIDIGKIRDFFIEITDKDIQVMFINGYYDPSRRKFLIKGSKEILEWPQNKKRYHAIRVGFHSQLNFDLEIIKIKKRLESIGIKFRYNIKDSKLTDIKYHSFIIID